MKLHSLLLVGALHFVILGRACATEKSHPLKIGQLNLQEVTLEQALDQIRAVSKKDDHDGIGLNIVLDTQGLAPVQTHSRITVRVTGVAYTNVFYAICKRLGLGYRIDPYAVVFGSGSKIALPTPRTAEAAAEASTLSRSIKLDLDFSADTEKR